MKIRRYRVLMRDVGSPHHSADQWTSHWSRAKEARATQNCRI